MRKETIFFIFSPVSSSTGLSKIGIKIYKLHEQTNKKERQGRRERRREGGRERERVLKIHLVCRYAEEELMPSLIEYYPFRPPILGPQAATLVLMAEFS